MLLSPSTSFHCLTTTTTTNGSLQLLLQRLQVHGAHNQLSGLNMRADSQPVQLQQRLQVQVQVVVVQRLSPPPPAILSPLQTLRSYSSLRW